MPTYDYRCTKCKNLFELFHGITDDTPKRCPRCKAKAVRVPSAGAGLLFKGTGFYITDYRSKSYKDKAKAEGSGAKSSESSGKGESTGKSSESSTKSESAGKSSGAAKSSGESRSKSSSGDKKGGARGGGKND